MKTYVIIQAIVFDRASQSTQVLWEVHRPAGYREATFRAYGGACAYVKRQTGKRYEGPFLAAPGAEGGEDKQTP